MPPFYRHLNSFSARLLDALNFPDLSADLSNDVWAARSVNQVAWRARAAG